MILSMIWSKLLLPVNNRSLYFEKHYRSAVMLFCCLKKLEYSSDLATLAYFRCGSRIYK